MVLSFDGKCVLCNGFVRFVMRHDSHRRLRFASSGTPAGAAIFRDYGQDPDNPATVVLVDGARRYGESEAIIRAIAALGGVWRLAALARLVPRGLRDAAYRYVAGNRYHWFGRLDRCAVPDAAQADRFLT